MATKLTRMVVVGLVLLAAVPALPQNKKIDEAVAKAFAQIQKNEAEKALQSADKLAKEGTAEALLAASRIQQAAGKLEEAATTASQAVVATAPPDVQARALAHLAGLDLVRGTGKDALDHATKAVAAQSNAETLAVLALAQAHTKSPQAVATAEQAVKLAPTNALVQDALGQALAIAGKHAEAEAALAKAIELDPKLYRAHIHHAQLLIATGRAAEAEVVAKKATELAPQQGIGFAALAEAMFAKDPKTAGAAIGDAQQGAFLTPHSAYVQFTVARIFEAMGNAGQAELALKRALEIDPGHTPARVALVQAQIRANKFDEAREEVRKLAEDNPNDGDTQRIFGQLLVRKEDYAAALEPLERATQLLPTNADAFALLGSAYQMNGQNKEAVVALKRALEIAPNNTDARVKYAYLLGVTKQTSAAIAELTKVINTPGYKSAEAHYYLGRAHMSAEPRKVLEATIAYKKALEVDPKFATGYRDLARAQLQQRAYSEALANLTQAAELDPKLACEAAVLATRVHYQMAVDAKSKDLGKARQSLAKARACATGDSLAKLAKSIDDAEKGETAPPPAPDDDDDRPKGPDLGTVARNLQSPDAATRRNAARQCAALGAECVPYLLPLINRDPDLGVKVAVAKTLGAINGPAAKACPQLKNEIGASAERMVLPVDTGKVSASDEAKRFGREQELQVACREAVAKIGCR